MNFAANQSFSSSAWPANIDLDRVSDVLAEISRYSIEQSKFYDIHVVATAGDGSEKLPAALQVHDRTSLSVAQSDVGAKYGIRNYIRIAADEGSAIQRELMNNSIKAVGTKNSAISHAQAIVKMMNRSYLLERSIRGNGRGTRREFSLACTSAHPAHCKVRKASKTYEGLDDHGENILFATRSQVAVGHGLHEILNEISDIAFSQHALERIWERSDKRHSNFHMALVDAYASLQESVATVVVAAWQNRQPLPAYVAAPFLGGMIIASMRLFYVPSSTNRYGFRTTGRRNSALTLTEDVQFPYESYALESLGELDMVTERPIFVGATYMGENDIGNLGRLKATHDFAALLSKEDAAMRVRQFRELFMQGVITSDDESLVMDADRILDLQRVMLHRDDPADDRIYVMTGTRHSF